MASSKPTSGSGEPGVPEQSDEGAGGAVIPLSKPVRVAVALGSGGLAVAHLMWPTLPIDTTFLGLLVVLIIGLFFDIERIDALGIHARARARRLAQAVRTVEALPVPTEPIDVPQAPRAVEAQDSISLLEQEVVHFEPGDLMPPIDPAERILWAMEEIRIELIVLAGNSGNLPLRAGWHVYDALQVARHLAQRTSVPPRLTAVMPLLIDARNDLVHGRLGSPKVLAQADQLALELLERLREIRRNWIRVLDADVSVFNDQSLASPMTAGVLLVALDDAGKVLWRQVHPRAHPYVRGRFVSWEWDLTRVFRKEGWYRDPVTKSAKVAWSQSATFIGREYPEQWGLEYRLTRPDAGLDV
jgi:hypothetical protein